LLAPLSEPLVACLATEHRRLTTSPMPREKEKLHIRVQARFLCAGRIRAVPCAHPGHFLFRTDVHRASDGVLMSSSLVERPCACRGR